MKARLIYYVAAVLTIIGCSSDGGNDSGPGTGVGSGGNNVGAEYFYWSIPVAEVVDGGPGKDGIPSIDNPIFYQANDPRVDVYMKPDDIIIGVIRDGEVRAYPHRILDWHEIVNDEIDGEKFSLNYCPLTGSAFAWESKVKNQESTFGVSGLLYNTNLILYDRATDSNWSQLTLECVNGESLGEIPKNLQIFETDWSTWETMYPNTKVLSNQQYLYRDYFDYPYGPYKEDHSFFLFPVGNLNPALPNKQRVHAVIDGEHTKSYTFDTFAGGDAIKDVFRGTNILVVGNDHIMQSFELRGSQINLNFTYEFSGQGPFFKDNEGNKWLINGEAVEGPRTGEKLKPTESLMSFWFAIGLFFPNSEVYQ
jgi:hypothetical protein